MRLHNKCWGTILYGKTAQTSEVITWYWQPRHHKWTMMWWDRTIQQKWLIKKLYKASVGILPSQSKVKAIEYDFSCHLLLSDEKRISFIHLAVKKIVLSGFFFYLFYLAAFCSTCISLITIVMITCIFFLSFIFKWQDKDNGQSDEATEAGAT